MHKLLVCQQMTFVSNQMRRPDSGPGRIALYITGALLQCPRDARCPGQYTAVQGPHPLGGQTAWAVLGSGLRQACHRPSLCCPGPSTAVVAAWSPEGGRNCSCASAASGGSSTEGLGGGGDPLSRRLRRILYGHCPCSWVVGAVVVLAQVPVSGDRWPTGH